MDGAEAVQCLAHDCVHGVGFGEVGRDCVYACGTRCEAVGEFVEGSRVASGEYDVCVLVGECPGQGSAEAAGGARQDHGVAAKGAHESSGESGGRVFAVDGSGSSGVSPWTTPCAAAISSTARRQRPGSDAIPGRAVSRWKQAVEVRS